MIYNKDVRLNLFIDLNIYLFEDRDSVSFQGETYFETKNRISRKRFLKPKP